MARDPLGPILRPAHAVAAGPAAGRSTADLLDCFARRGDGATFAALLQRHGPLVWGVCRRRLRDRHLAEDAFQATFLILARRAATIRRPESLGCWLYNVARSVMARMRAPATLPQPDLEAAAPSQLDTLTVRECLAVLDEELGRLPERLRAPLVPCYLDGRTRDEAAAALGWSLGTFKRRLEQGRAALRSRLERRGVGLPAVLLPSVLAECGPGGAVPAGFTAATVRAAAAYTSGALAGPACTVANGVVRALVWAKLRSATLLLAGPFIAALAGWGAWTQGAGQLSPPDADAKAPKALAADGGPAPPRTDAHGDPLPPGAFARLGTTRFVGDTVVFSPDGATLLTRTRRAGLRLLDADTGRELAAVADVNSGRQSAGPVDIVGVLPDGKAVVAVGTFLPLSLWGVKAGRRLRTFGDAAGEARFTAAAVTADGRWLAGGRRGGPLSVFDAATGHERYQAAPLGSGSWKTAFSADGRTLVAAEVGRPSRVRLLDGATGAERERLPDPGDYVRGLALAPGGRLLAWSFTSTVTVWDIANRKVLFDWRAPRRGRWAGEYAEDVLTFSPDGTMLAASENGATVIWDVATGKEIRRWPAERYLASNHALAFSPDGRRLAVSGEANRITVLDVATGALVAPRHNHSKEIRSLAVSRDGRTIATAGEDPALRLWDAETGRELRCLVSPFDDIHAVAYAPDGRTVAGGGYKIAEPGPHGGVRWWDARTGAEVGSVALPEEAFPLTFPPARDAIFIKTMKDKNHVLWDPAAKRELHRFGGGGDGVFEGAMTPDGRRLVTHDAGNAVIVWDRDGDKVRTIVPAPTDLFARIGSPLGPHVAISADGRTVAAAYGREWIGVWEVASGSLRRQFVPGEIASPLAFSPDGRTLAYGARSNDDQDSLVLWDLAAGVERARYASRHGSVRAIAFAPDGRFVVSGGTDTTALVWPVPPAALPAAVNLDACWANLAGADAGRAYAAHWRMTADPARTVPFLRERLRPAEPLTQALRDEVRRAVAELGSPKFPVRRQAAQRLQELGERAVPLLRDALAQKPSAEVKQQLGQLLGRAETPPTAGEDVRAQRAVEVLERVGTPDARRLLEGLAGGAPEAGLTREARASLNRLAKAPAKP